MSECEYDFLGALARHGWCCAQGTGLKRRALRKRFA